MGNDTLSRHATGLLVGFFVQFLSGMTLNLFVTLPATHPGSAGSNYFVRSARGFVWTASGAGSVALAIHAYIAIALFFGCIGLFARGFSAHDQSWTMVGANAGLLTLGALLHGISFIMFNQEINSLVMAICWLVAVGALVMGLSRNPAGGWRKVKNA